MTAPTAAAVGSPGRYAADITAYREALRSYLAGIDWADEWRRPSTSAAEGMRHDTAVLQRLFEAGWNRYGWPVEAGGLGGDVLHRAVYFEELAYAMLPVPAQQWTLEVIAPVLLDIAPELAQQHLPSYLDGSQWWGQCFSEPEAGSDLATLRTKAVADGDGGYVISGQKIWTSQGPGASRFLVLARTGSPDSRHRGLTTFMVEADTPGVTVRPIALASGREEVAEVFFDDVHVGPERVVGDIDGGWSVVMFLMQFERGMYGYASLTKALTELGQLRVDLITRGSTQSERDRFTRTYLNVAAAQARCAGTVRALAAGIHVGPASSVDKLLASHAEREAFDLIFEMRQDWMIGSGFQGAEDGAELSLARAEWWYSRAATVMGGTAEVQRGIIADHLLGLPKEKR
ncbi:acyl-CoA dehydrogenase family protein [Mycolicibacterium fluoranthenivorans]|uniref:Acyl-CoA dehydrogenase family protein n=1 Tax=Mycolicibacterium fluoranthenivorans TaxID=258505 RepID=A0A7G8PG84_9MYCO|nr:acyl-CoA dehydrogenase family protein [Mycolicibacterium fluoranthenivorans]QNJ93350.1 acyl-CoA dehydrogenase family protein [Mycolicibacterium fluoranthenivorans]